MADLTEQDVPEIKAYLSGTCLAIERWLPGPEWPAGWRSEAARERANSERGPGGPWGGGPVRSVYVAAALFLEAVLQCLRALGDAMTVETTAYMPNTLTRAAMESGSRAVWLLEPGVGARCRVARFVLIRASGARYLNEAVSKIDPGSVGSYGETPADVSSLASRLGVTLAYAAGGPDKGWRCDTEKLPTYTQFSVLMEKATRMSAAYNIYSASAHAEWHAIIGDWREVDQGNGQILLMRRPDRIAVWAAVMAGTSYALEPARRALELVDGQSARLVELGRWSTHGLRLMQQMNLPREWWSRLDERV